MTYGSIHEATNRSFYTFYFRKASERLLPVEALKIIPKFVPIHSSLMVCSGEGVSETGQWRLEIFPFPPPLLPGKRPQASTPGKRACAWLPANPSQVSGAQVGAISSQKALGHKGQKSFDNL